MLESSDARTQSPTHTPSHFCQYPPLHLQHTPINHCALSSAPGPESSDTWTLSLAHTPGFSHTPLDHPTFSLTAVNCNADLVDNFVCSVYDTCIMCCRSSIQCTCTHRDTEELVAYKSLEDSTSGQQSHSCKSDQLLYPYTSDLQALEACSNNLKITFPTSTTLITPLRVDR